MSSGKVGQVKLSVLVRKANREGKVLLYRHPYCFHRQAEFGREFCCMGCSSEPVCRQAKDQIEAEKPKTDLLGQEE